MSGPGYKLRWSDERMICTATQHIVIEKTRVVTAHMLPNHRSLAAITSCQYN